MIDQIIEFENGMLSEREEISLFSHLVKTGMAWQLQGMYGRQAKYLMDNGVIDRNGNVLIDLNEVY
jgi:hypothetical protein